MNRIEKIQARVGKHGKSVFSYTTDFVEWSARKNIAVAEDVAKFTVKQMRLPLKADGFADYSKDLRVSYSKFGGVLKRHGGDYVAKFKDIPEEVRAIFAPKKTAKRKAPAKAKATKARATKKAKAKVAKPKVTKTVTAKAVEPKAIKKVAVEAKA